MFYCEECRQKKDWPPYGWMRDVVFKSNGPCEVCKQTAICYDFPKWKIDETLEANKNGD